MLKYLTNNKNAHIAIGSLLTGLSVNQYNNYINKNENLKKIASKNEEAIKALKEDICIMDDLCHIKREIVTIKAQMHNGFEKLERNN